MHSQYQIIYWGPALLEHPPCQGSSQRCSNVDSGVCCQLGYVNAVSHLRPWPQLVQLALLFGHIPTLWQRLPEVPIHDKLCLLLELSTFNLALVVTINPTCRARREVYDLDTAGTTPFPPCERSQVVDTATVDSADYDLTGPDREAITEDFENLNSVELLGSGSRSHAGALNT